MNRNVLIISSSPRKNGNTSILCTEFANGAQEAGNNVEIINLCDKNINYCMDCEVCRINDGICVIQDDIAEIVDKMIKCDVLVLSTPVYFYSITAQLKTFIDRTYAREHELRSMAEKPAYLILTCAGPLSEHMETAIADLNGYIKCLRTVRVAGIIKGLGLMTAGAVKNNPVMQEAYEMGKNI